MVRELEHSHQWVYNGKICKIDTCLFKMIDISEYIIV